MCTIMIFGSIPAWHVHRFASEREKIDTRINTICTNNGTVKYLLHDELVCSSEDRNQKIKKIR